MAQRLFLLLALGVLAAWPLGAAADDYDVTTPGSYYQISGKSGSNPPLTLHRGQTYNFHVNAIEPSGTRHPFWIKSAPGPQGTGAFTDGVSNNGTASGLVTFTVPSSAPSALLYQCGVHYGMQAAIKITGGESCSTNADCDSGLYCTLGVCCLSSSCSAEACNTPSCGGGTCSSTRAANGTTCDDGDGCTTGDKCTSGICGGAPKSCPGKTCNSGYCSAGACKFSPLSGGICNDGNACTTSDTCNAGTCAGATMLCNSPGPCQLNGGTCSSGACTYTDKPAGFDCSTDANLSGQTCDANHVCSGGQPDTGNAFLWGRNDSAQIGNAQSGTLVNAPRRLTASGMNDLIAVAPGYHHTLALDVRGNVFAWGSNGSGEVKIAAPSTALVTTPSQQMYYARAIAAGFQHSIAINVTGGVDIWGMLGNGTLKLGSTPNPAIAIAAGDYHGVALTADGQVWTWGYNSSGQLGVYGSPASLMTPIPVSLPKPARAIAAGASYTLVLLADGTIYGWGANYAYTLANSNTNPSYRAIRVGTLSNVRAIAAGGDHALALLADGTLRAWGDNGTGELGDGKSNTSTYTPVTVSGIDRVQAISAGNSVSMAVRADGTVWAWGYNGDRLLGNPAIDSNTIATTPKQIPGLSAISAVTGPNGTAAVVQSTGSIKSFGSNANGQLGIGKTEAQSASSSIPLPVVAAQTTPATVLPAFKAVSSGSSPHRLALGADGSVWAWGLNQVGQLGNSGGDSTTPVKVAGISDAIGVYAGDYDSFALRADGTLWAWGANTVGNRGDGTTSSAVYSTPAQITALGNTVIDVGARNNTLALKADGSVYAWGWNRWWQCGSTANKSAITTPIALALPASSPYGRAVAAGTYNSYVLLANGTVAAYGRNDGGELGIGTTGDPSATPQLVKGVSGASAIAAGSHFALAMIGSSALYGWGVNSSNRLGTATSPVFTPVSLAAAYVRGVSAGQNATYIVVVNGAGMAMGSNTSGALGINTADPNASNWTAISGATEVISAAGGLNGAEILLQ